MALKVGAVAPKFTLPNEKGESVALTDLHGQYVVLFFYPKDMTPGCTQEACDFRDAIPRFKGLKAAVFGISRDDEASHRKYMGIERTTYVINPEGKIHAVFEKVKVTGHVAEVEAAISGKPAVKKKPARKK